MLQKIATSFDACVPLLVDEPVQFMRETLEQSLRSMDRVTIRVDEKATNRVESAVVQRLKTTQWQ